MFELEQAITAWRQQMLAAGIQSPVPLEELEIHLREEIAQQLQSGLDERTAFERATTQIGQAPILKTEFKKARRWFDLGADNPQARTQRRLAVLWFAHRCYGLFSTFYLFFYMIPPRTAQHIDVGFYGALGTLECVSLIGTAGSILLFFGKERGRWIVRIFALFSVAFLIGSTLQIALLGGRFTIFSGVLRSVYLIFDITSIWLLRPQQKSKLAHN